MFAFILLKCTWIKVTLKARSICRQKVHLIRSLSINLELAFSDSLSEKFHKHWKTLGVEYFLNKVSVQVSSFFKKGFQHWSFLENFRLYQARTQRGVQEVRNPALFRYNRNCALKLLNQFRRNALKNQFKNRKNPSKRCTNSILLKFFNFTLTGILKHDSHQ